MVNPPFRAAPSIDCERKRFLKVDAPANPPEPVLTYEHPFQPPHQAGAVRAAPLPRAARSGRAHVRAGHRESGGEPPPNTAIRTPCRSDRNIHSPSPTSRNAGSKKKPAPVNEAAPEKGGAGEGGQVGHPEMIFERRLHLAMKQVSTVPVHHHEIAENHLHRRMALRKNPTPPEARPAGALIAVQAGQNFPLRAPEPRFIASYIPAVTLHESLRDGRLVSQSNVPSSEPASCTMCSSATPWSATDATHSFSQSELRKLGVTIEKRRRRVHARQTMTKKYGSAFSGSAVLPVMPAGIQLSAAGRAGASFQASAGRFCGARALIPPAAFHH